MRTSARNHLPGVITAIKRGQVMAQIEIQVGDNQIVAVITQDAADDLALKEGDRVTAVIKATEVMVGKEDA